jgi:serralysin
VGDHFKDKDDRILYYKQGGALFYDPDGSGSAKAVQFASLSKNLKISHKDFFVL